MSHYREAYEHEKNRDAEARREHRVKRMSKIQSVLDQLHQELIWTQGSLDKDLHSHLLQKFRELKALAQDYLR